MTRGGKRKNAGRPSLGEVEAVLIRIPPVIKNSLKDRAVCEGESFNSLVAKILAAAVENPMEAL